MRLKRTLNYALLASAIVILVWSLSVKGEGSCAYGNIITFEDKGSAELFGVHTPGVYVGDRRGECLPAIRGALKMTLTGDADRACRGFITGVKRSPLAIVTLAALASMVAYRLFGKAS